MMNRMLKNEHGGALLMALFFGLMLSVLGVTAFYVASSEITHAGSTKCPKLSIWLRVGWSE